MKRANRRVGRLSMRRIGQISGVKPEAIFA